jgi:hypothetical protein
MYKQYVTDSDIDYMYVVHMFEQSLLTLVPKVQAQYYPF